MEKADILDWLRNQEECMLWDLGMWPQEMSKGCRDNLQIIRDLKQLVNESYRWDEDE
jgi:hypothetical protein